MLQLQINVLAWVPNAKKSLGKSLEKVCEDWRRLRLKVGPVA